MSTRAAGEALPNKGPLERVLAPIADVGRGEALSALLMALTMFFTLYAYYLLKTAREVFILAEGGAEVKSYSSAGQALLLLGLVPADGKLASAVNRTQLIQWVTLFFAMNLALFMLALGSGLHIGIVFFLWGIFNLMVIAQFWAFANDLYTREQGKRLFPLIGVGSSLGAWAGSVQAGSLVATAGPGRLLAVGAILLVGCVVLARLVDWTTRREAPSRAKQADEKLEGGPNGFAMIASDRYLAMIAGLVVVLNIVNTSGEYLLGTYVVSAAEAAHGAGPQNEAARQQLIGATYSSFYSYVNLFGFLMQMFVVSRVFKFLGVGKALFIHPLVALGGYLMMLQAPSFNAIRVLKIADNSLDYSLDNTTRQALWLPTSREAKSKAKQAVDSFCQRAGDVLQAGIVYASTLVGFGVTAFAALNIIFVGGWLAVSVGLNRRLRARAQQAGKDQL
jgi:AAA family ATP:ADP antiporter